MPKNAYFYKGKKCKFSESHKEGKKNLIKKKFFPPHTLAFGPLVLFQMGSQKKSPLYRFFFCGRPYAQRHNNLQNLIGEYVGERHGKSGNRSQQKIFIRI